MVNSILCSSSILTLPFILYSWCFFHLFYPFWKVCMLVQFSSVTHSCPTLCHPMNRSTPGLPVHHQLPESTQTHAHRVGDAIQSSHPLSSPSPPAPSPSQHQGLFQWVNSLHEVANVLEFQLQHRHINICTVIANFPPLFYPKVALISWFIVTRSPQILTKVEEMGKFIWEFYLKRMVLKTKR